tara:strand:- start:140 stop:625 length:486 start_codon:yes stop_codon:yes gene_type:complete
MTAVNTEDKSLKEILEKAKTVAMIGVSSSEKEEVSTSIKRRPSVIVMKYLQDFGYKVIPVNPFSVGKKINGEIIVGNLSDIDVPIDIVNVFRPSKEAAGLAEQAVKNEAKTLWLQFGIESKEAQKIANSANIYYVANRCIKQEYQRLFLKVNPVFPALLNN